MTDDVRHTSTYAKAEEAIRSDERSQLSPESVTVPIEPTHEMWAAMANAVIGKTSVHHDVVVEAVYRAMVASAPSAGLAQRQQVPAEKIARTITLSYGRDPDEMTSIMEMCDADNRPVPIWRVYEEQADAILAAYSVSSTDRPDGYRDAWLQMIAHCNEVKADRFRLEQTIRDSIEALERNSTSAPVVECLKAALPVSSPACPGGVDPGFEECPKCGATMDDACAHVEPKGA